MMIVRGAVGLNYSVLSNAHAVTDSAIMEHTVSASTEGIGKAASATLRIARGGRRTTSSTTPAGQPMANPFQAIQAQEPIGEFQRPLTEECAVLSFFCMQMAEKSIMFCLQ